MCIYKHKAIWIPAMYAVVPTPSVVPSVSAGRGTVDFGTKDGCFSSTSELTYSSKSDSRVLSAGLSPSM